MRARPSKENQYQPQASSTIRKSQMKPLVANHTVQPILRLQRTIGNQAVRQLLHPNDEALEAGSDTAATSCFAHDLSRIPVSFKAPVSVQAKLTANTPQDICELGAGGVPEQMMRTPEPSLQRVCPCRNGCSNCRTEQAGREHGVLQTRRVGSGGVAKAPDPSVVDEALSSSGHSLDTAPRAVVEPRLGHDLPNVCLHRRNRAAQSAQAVNALAYTVGDDMVFSARQHGPSSSSGLTSHDEVAGHQGISRAPNGVIARRLPPDWQEEIPEWYWEDQRKKAAAIKKHEDDQRTVIDLMDKARQIRPDPKKGFRDPDNLVRNTVQMFDAGRFRLTILSPSHYSDDLHFDVRVKHPTIGGDYPSTPPKDPRAPGRGLVYDKTSGGRFEPASPATIPQIETLPKVERAPGEVAPKEKPTPVTTSGPPVYSPFAAGDMYIFTRGSDVASQFRQVFVHEGQHVADLATQLVTGDSVDAKLEAYKSEFRAFWIQPLLQRTSLLAPGGTSFAEPTEKAQNSKKVDIDSLKTCSLCPPGDPSGKAFAEPKTAMKNARQEEIFWHILTNYPNHQYDCCYVFNERFHKAVDEFANPQSVNLINSERLMDLSLGLQSLKRAMTRSQVRGTNLVGVLTKLEPLDWAYLNDPKLAKPFWDTFNANAPDFVKNGMKALLKRRPKAAVSEAEVKKALSV